MEDQHYFNINESSRIPKYKQVMDSITNGIRKEHLLMGDKLLSINALSERFDLSRDTVEKAYSMLRAQNIIESVKGKGFYVAKTDLTERINVLFLINKLSTYKMRIFNSFVNTLGRNARVDLEIYHCEQEVFQSILKNKMKSFDYFVMMFHFKNNNLQHIGSTEKVLNLVKEIPDEKLIVLDRKVENHFHYAGEVYQDFKDDIYSALSSGLRQLKKYKKIILVYPSKAIYPYPKEIVHGFKAFCLENNIDHEILDEIYDSMELQVKDLYIIIQESDLVNLVKQIRDRHYKLGDDIGIISYNDTPLKDLLGITVVSTDFKKMGATAAKMILDNNKSSVKNDFNFINRFSA